MDLPAAGLTVQPFPTYGNQTNRLSYRAYRDALAMLNKLLDVYNGLALLQGPRFSGKTTLVHEFVDSLPDDYAFALVDGAGLDATGLLEVILREFGYPIEFNSIGESLAMTRVFALQQASSDAPPLVLIDNAHALNSDAWPVVSELAELRARQSSALKLVFISDRSLRDVVQRPKMEPLRRRLTADFHMRPMTSEEARDYLYAKLHAAGSDKPEFIFPAAVCHDMWLASGGWPGILDDIAVKALGRAETLPVDVAEIDHPELPLGTWIAQSAEFPPASDGPLPPTLYVTLNGETTNSLLFDKARVLIGRSEHNDLTIDSRWISRHHVLLVRNGEKTYLMDLNSTNGTYVNSRRVSVRALMDDDIIAIGQHRIKYCDPQARLRPESDSETNASTDVMKSLEDMRAMIAQPNAPRTSA